MLMTMLVGSVWCVPHAGQDLIRSQLRLNQEVVSRVGQYNFGGASQRRRRQKQTRSDDHGVFETKRGRVKRREPKKQKRTKEKKHKNKKEQEVVTVMQDSKVQVRRRVQSEKRGGGGMVGSASPGVSSEVAWCGADGQCSSGTAGKLQSPCNGPEREKAANREASPKASQGPADAGFLVCLSLFASTAMQLGRLQAAWASLAAAASAESRSSVRCATYCVRTVYLRRGRAAGRQGGSAKPEVAVPVTKILH
jgi:hypothetical protein